jgi:hypothetical protein
MTSIARIKSRLAIVALTTTATLFSSPVLSGSSQISDYFWFVEQDDDFGRKTSAAVLYGTNSVIDIIKRMDMSNELIPHFPKQINFECNAEKFRVRMVPQGEWILGSGRIKIEYQFSSSDRVISERWNLIDGVGILPSGYKDFLAGFANAKNKSLKIRATDYRGESRTNTFILNQVEVQTMLAVKNNC